MLITKIIETGLDIDNPMDVYVDANASIMAILRMTYEGKCFRGCRIEQVNKILKISECIIDRLGSKCTGKVSIVFEVTATVYVVGEIIVGCVIIRKDPKLVIMQGPRECVMLKSGAFLNNFQTSQTIPIIVGDSMYNINSDKISVNAVPYIPLKTYNCFQIVHVMTAEDKEFLTSAISRMEAEEKLFNAIENKQGRDFFTTMTYAYKGEQAMPVGAMALEYASLIKDITNTANDASVSLNGWYARDKRIQPSKAMLYMYKEKPTDSNANCITTLSARVAIQGLIEDYISSLRLIRELNATYNNEAMLTAHKNLWKALTLTK